MQAVTSSCQTQRPRLHAVNRLGPPRPLRSFAAQPAARIAWTQKPSLRPAPRARLDLICYSFASADPEAQGSQLPRVGMDGPPVPPDPDCRRWGSGAASDQRSNASYPASTGSKQQAGWEGMAKLVCSAPVASYRANGTAGKAGPKARTQFCQPQFAGLRRPPNDAPAAARARPTMGAMTIDHRAGIAMAGRRAQGNAGTFKGTQIVCNGSQSSGRCALAAVSKGSKATGPVRGQSVLSAALRQPCRGRRRQQVTPPPAR